MLVDIDPAAGASAAIGPYMNGLDGEPARLLVILETLGNLAAEWVAFLGLYSYKWVKARGAPRVGVGARRLGQRRPSVACPLNDLGFSNSFVQFSCDGARPPAMRPLGSIWKIIL